MAQPFKDGKTWSVRVRAKGHDIFLSGFKTARDAQASAERKRVEILDGFATQHGGAKQHTVAQALYRYGVERLPYQKGADKEANRINRYLEPAGLGRLTCGKVEASALGAQTRYWEVTHTADVARRVPNGLNEHRKKQKADSARSEKARGVLARMAMSDVRPFDIQQLVNALRDEGRAASTIKLEQSLLCALFKQALTVWNWKEPAANPALAKRLTLPKIDNARTRVLAQDEFDQFVDYLNSEPNQVRNPFVPFALILLLETAMRCGEAIGQINWDSFDRQRKVLRLRNAKGGARDVPLGPVAFQALLDIEALCKKTGHSTSPDAPILPLTYEALKAAFGRWRKASGVKNIRLHDLRHTAATRYCIEFNGNVFMLKRVTGHKTLSQLERYVNFTAEDVVRLMHGGAPDGRDPAGLRADGVSRTQDAMRKMAVSVVPPKVPDVRPPDSNVIVGRFGEHGPRGAAA